MLKRKLIYVKKYGIPSILLFFLVYGVKFSFFFLALSKIGLLFLLCWYILNKLKSNKFSFYRDGLIIFVGLIVLIVYSTFIIIANNGPNFTFTSRLIYLLTEPLVGGGIFASFLVKEKKYDSHDFLILLRNIGLIQVILTIPSYFIPELNMLYLDILPNTGNIQEDNVVRIRGFSNLGGASLSVLLSISALASLALIDCERGGKVLNFITVIFVIVACIMIGRTGLLICLLILSTYFIRWLVNGVLLKRLWPVLALLLVVAVPLYSMFTDLTESMNPETLAWAFEMFDESNFGQSRSSDELGSMLFLPSGIKDLFFGTGLYHESYLNYPRSDSGYVNTILVVGIIGAFIFYCGYWYVLCKTGLSYRKNGSILFFIFIFSLICLVVEIKEPFLQVIGLPIIIFTLFFFSLFNRYQRV